MYIKLCSLLVLVISVQAHAQWPRTVSSGKGQFTDTPSAHSLRYFTANPLERDDGDELCNVCTPESKSHGSAILTTKLSPVGALAGFKIWDLIYTGEKSLWKSILVQAGPDRYKEIYRLQTSGLMQPLNPTRIVR